MSVCWVLVLISILVSFIRKLSCLKLFSFWLVSMSECVMLWVVVIVDILL